MDNHAEDTIDLMVSLMRNKRASIRLVEVAAEVIAAEARLSQCVERLKGEKKGADRIWDIMDHQEDLIAECVRASAELQNDADVDAISLILKNVREKMDDILNDGELESIRQRCELATPGPWQSFIEGRDHTSGSSFIMTGGGTSRGSDIELSGATVADQDFIAHARQDIPRLLAELGRLRALKNRSV